MFIKALVSKESVFFLNLQPELKLLMKKGLMDQKWRFLPSCLLLQVLWEFWCWSGPMLVMFVAAQALYCSGIFSIRVDNCNIWPLALSAVALAPLALKIRISVH